MAIWFRRIITTTTTIKKVFTVKSISTLLAWVGSILLIGSDLNAQNCDTVDEGLYRVVTTDNASGSTFSGQTTISLTSNGISISDFSGGVMIAFGSPEAYEANLIFDCQHPTHLPLILETVFGNCELHSVQWNETQKMLTIGWKLSQIAVEFTTTMTLAE